VAFKVRRPLRLDFTINNERLERIKQTGYFTSLAEYRTALITAAVKGQLTIP
jgi:hypothetical protein